MSAATGGADYLLITCEFFLITNYERSGLVAKVRTPFSGYNFLCNCTYSWLDLVGSTFLKIQCTGDFFKP